MGKKGGKFKRKENTGLVKNKSSKIRLDDEDMMNDEIDAFHKNRDVVPLNLNEDMGDSDEDNEHPVLDFEDDEDEDEEVEDEDFDDDKPQKGLAAKIIRTQKYLQSKFGGIEDETLDDSEEEEEKMDIWGKKNPYGNDVDNKTPSSDDEDAAEEEAEVLRLQSEKAKLLSMEDFGLEDASEDETGKEPTSEVKRVALKEIAKGINEEDGMTYEIVKKDINALTKEEQMNLIYSSAPELVGLLSELKEAHKELEDKVSPLVNKISAQGSSKKGGLHYFEVKQLVLQSYCQAIVFYLLLKSEGQPVRDHPVISRLVEIKSLLDTIKEIDDNLPFDLEDLVSTNVNNTTIRKLVEEAAVLESDSLTNSQIVSAVSSENQAMLESQKAAELNTLSSQKKNKSQQKHLDQQVGIQSMEMLKLRASLEEKLKQKGLFNTITPKNGRTGEQLQPMNRQLETLDDFVDEAMEIDGAANGRSSKISQQLALRPNKRKVISGDDDLPRRDDIGERRRKHELRVLAGAGIKSSDYVEEETGNISSDGIDHVGGESEHDSDLEYYNEVERKHSAKLAAKSDKYNRTTEVLSVPEDTVDGKRYITRQIEKNRGLTRARKKLIKNPRKKYKLQHQKAKVRRKGQVREVRKPTGPYGGEASGINAGISRSVRFKN
ncbi:hypothetical protein ABFS83_14G290100 [Erythranthe nasuta]